MNGQPRISAKVNVSTIAAVLGGQLSWRQMLRAAPPATLNTRASGCQAVVGFVPHVDYPDQILVTSWALRGAMIPVASLAYGCDGWSAIPQIVNTKWLSEREAVEIEPTDWIFALSTLTAELRIRREWRDIDLIPWTIAAAWPKWQTVGLTWAERADDLAKRLGANPLSPNSLTVKCKRMGLRK